MTSEEPAFEVLFKTVFGQDVHERLDEQSARTLYSYAAEARLLPDEINLAERAGQYAALTLFHQSLIADGQPVVVFATDGTSWILPAQSILAIQVIDPTRPADSKPPIGYRPPGKSRNSVPQT